VLTFKLQTSAQPQPQPKPKMSPRRFSELFRQAFQSEAQAKELAKWVEQHPLFQMLRSKGIIRRVSLRELIPPGRYNDYMERRAIRFVNQHKLYERPEWKQIWEDPDAEAHLGIWAERMGVPEDELRGVFRFLRAQPSQAREKSLEDLKGGAETAATVDVEGIDDLISTVSGFVHRYGLTRQEFADYVLSGRCSAKELSDRFGCPLVEAENLLDSIDRLCVREEISGPGVSFPSNASAAGSVSEALLPEAWVDDRGSLRLRFSGNQPRYVIDQQRLNDWKKSEGENDELRRFFEAVQALNERGSALASIVHTVCSAQKDFIASGNVLDLGPLSQSDVARLTGYHRSVVCRLTREQWIVTPHGRLALKQLMPRLQEVISRIVEAHPDWRNSQVAEYLQQRFGVSVSRREVAYHRNRFIKQAGS